MRIYLDNCCFNRPFDDQTLLRIRIETEAKLYLQDLLRGRKLEFAWSYMLDYENDANPFEERRQAIAGWKQSAACDVDESAEIVSLAEQYASMGIKASDSLHVACAVAAGCKVFLTTDDRLLKRRAQVTEIEISDPSAFVRELD